MKFSFSYLMQRHAVCGLLTGQCLKCVLLNCILKNKFQVWNYWSFVTGLAGTTQVQRTSSRGSIDSPKANVSAGVMSVQPIK